MEKGFDIISLRPRSRRQKTELGICQDCRAKLTDENWTPSQQKYGRYICGKCWTARQRKYQEADPARKIRKKEKAEQTRAAWSEDRERIETRKRYNRWLKRKYGICIEDYEEKLKSQNFECAICETSNAGGRGEFHVDHCHKAGVIRSLLCTTCNMMLGMAEDSPDRLRKAALYIETHAVRTDHKPEARLAVGGKRW